MTVRPMIRYFQYKCLEIEKVPYFISKFSLYRYKKCYFDVTKSFYGGDWQIIRKFTVQLSELSELSQKIPVLFWNIFNPFRLSILSIATKLLRISFLLLCTKCMSLIEEMVFCYQNCSDLLWEKIVLVIEKNIWNSRLKAENL